MFPKMPYKMQELPFRNITRWYKVYPSGVTTTATEEEIAVWVYVEALRDQLANANREIGLAMRKRQTPVDPKAPVRGIPFRRMDEPPPIPDDAIKCERKTD